MIEKKTVIDKIEILSSGVIQIKELNQIVEDGIVIASTAHRRCIQPGQSYTAEPEQVSAVCALIHTTDCVAGYNPSRAFAR